MKNRFNEKNHNTQNAHRTSRGITLVALVITIIVLLILAGVAINLAVNSEGLFAKTNEAANKWNTAVGNEEQSVQNLLLQGEEATGNWDHYYVDGVNKPRLAENMIPVYYDNGWKKADTNNSENSWYQYDITNKKWANAVTVSQSSRENYLTAEVGTTINEDDMVGMFVWIPRYAYKITSGYHPASSTPTPLEGSIEIKFLKGIKDEYEGGTAIRSNVTNGENFVVHPAFTNDTANGGGNSETTGFWVAKFEASSNTTTASNPNLGNKYGRTNNTTDEVTIRPNVTSWRYIGVPEIYQVCKNMSKEGNIHGLGRNTNPHMMKNSEWGAVAYLTQSDYGNKQTKADDSSGVWNNPYYEGDVVVNESSISQYYTTMTGMVGSSRDEGISPVAKATGTIDKNDSETITITYQNYNSDGTTSGSEYSRTYYRYQTTQGQKGSSTGNVYGIYDLAGVAWEYVAGYLGTGTNDYVKFFKKNLQASEKQEYIGTEAASDVTKTNYQANSEKYGDAVWETSRDDAGTGALAWNDDSTYFPHADGPFFLRGGTFGSFSNAGVFAFHFSWRWRIQLLWLPPSGRRVGQKSKSEVRSSERSEVRRGQKFGEVKSDIGTCYLRLGTGTCQKIWLEYSGAQIQKGI